MESEERGDLGKLMVSCAFQSLAYMDAAGLWSPGKIFVAKDLNAMASSVLKRRIVLVANGRLAAGVVSKPSI